MPKRQIADADFLRLTEWVNLAVPEALETEAFSDFSERMVEACKKSLWADEKPPLMVIASAGDSVEHSCAHFFFDVGRVLVRTKVCNLSLYANRYNDDQIVSAILEDKQAHSTGESFYCRMMERLREYFRRIFWSDEHTPPTIIELGDKEDERNFALWFLLTGMTWQQHFSKLDDDLPDLSDFSIDDFKEDTP